MASRSERLAQYRGRRDFRRSPEPGRTGPHALKPDGNPVFVIQQHAASTMHWDFRIEVGGALRSWAVPKGPSTDPRQRRLAVATEDHPLEYADFEGVIPEGEYGAGAVIVWDARPYANLTTDDDGRAVAVDRAIDRGHVSLWLEGRKIRGGYALVRRAGAGAGSEQWLLIKARDEGADARRRPTVTEPRSVLSGRTVDEVAAGDEDGR